MRGKRMKINWWSTIVASVLLPACVSAQAVEIRKLQHELKQAPDSAAYVKKLNRVSMLMHLKDPDSAFIYALRSKNITARLKDLQGDADATNVMAIALAVKGMQHDAMNLFKQALAKYKRLDDASNMVQVYMNMSVLFSSLEQTQNMLEYSRRAMKLGKKIPNDSILSLVYSNYATLNDKMPADSLRFYLSKSNAIAQRYKDSRVLLVNRQIEASKLMAGTAKKEALPVLMQVLEQSKRLGIEYAEISAHQALAEYYRDNPATALQHSEQALSVANSNGYSYLTPLILDDIMHYSRLAGDEKKELETARQLVAAVKMQQHQTELFLHDYLHFDDLQRENKLLEDNSKADNKRILLLLVFSALSALFTIAMVWLYRKTRKVSMKKSTMNRAIRRKNEKLEKSDHFKNRLVSILAHDFRSPLISTISVVEILSAHPDLSAEEMDAFYARIKNDVSKILDRFDLTLQWIRQQLKGYTLQLVNLQPRQLFDDAAQNFASQLQQAQLKFINNIPPDLTMVSDKEMLQFINRNLLSNAIKYSPVGGKITIGFQLQNGKISIEVSDEGKGLDEKSFQNLFSVGDYSGSTKEGAGIALSMCQDFITKLGGEITAANNSSGGATFTYSLPMEPAKVMSRP